jgi:hypothetical protein
MFRKRRDAHVVMVPAERRGGNRDAGNASRDYARSNTGPLRLSEGPTRRRAGNPAPLGQAPRSRDTARDVFTGLPMRWVNAFFQVPRISWPAPGAAARDWRS